MMRRAAARYFMPAQNKTIGPMGLMGPMEKVGLVQRSVSNGNIPELPACENCCAQRLSKVSEWKARKARKVVKTLCSTTIQSVGVESEKSEKSEKSCENIVLNDYPKCRSVGCPK
ncbi:MAG: hypothetical protein WCV67_13220 [Victivallaceae bacterium]